MKWSIPNREAISKEKGMKVKNVCFNLHVTSPVDEKMLPKSSHRASHRGGNDTIE
jgi:hypothetical protein